MVLDFSVSAQLQELHERVHQLEKHMIRILNYIKDVELAVNEPIDVEDMKFYKKGKELSQNRAITTLRRIKNEK